VQNKIIKIGMQRSYDLPTRIPIIGDTRVSILSHHYFAFWAHAVFLLYANQIIKVKKVNKILVRSYAINL
jgi:hypothetical protein